MLRLLILLCPLLLGAAELAAGRYRAATLQPTEAASTATLFERLQGEVGAMEVELVGDDNALLRSGGQILWLHSRDDTTMTFSGSWTEAAEIFTRKVIIPLHEEKGVRIGGIIDEWSGGRRTERILVLIADQ
ncbi:MAG: hypothetical protein PF961_22990 [Planctomycetota bacterium]|nr:hypothetical protein [Planctomycetota bacterium]